MGDIALRIERGRKAIKLAKEKGMDTSSWEKELVTFRGARNKETWRGIRLLDARERLLVTSSTPEVTSIPGNTTSRAYATELSGTEVTEVTSQAQNKAVTSAEKRGAQVTSCDSDSDPWDEFLREMENGSGN